MNERKNALTLGSVIFLIGTDSVEIPLRIEKVTNRFNSYIWFSKIKD